MQWHSFKPEWKNKQKVNDAKIRFSILMIVVENNGELNSRNYEGCLNYGCMCELKWNYCLVYQSSINWYLDHAVCLSAEYQVSSIEKWYGTGPQDQKYIKVVFPALSPLLKHEKVNNSAKGSLFCLHLKHYIEHWSNIYFYI